MVRPDAEDEDAWTLALSDTTSIETRVRLLSYRMSVVVREKEEMNRELKKLKLAYDMGRGVFWAAPVIGAVVAFFWYNWAKISSPWSGRP